VGKSVLGGISVRLNMKGSGSKGSMWKKTLIKEAGKKEERSAGSEQRVQTGRGKEGTFFIYVERTNTTKKRAWREKRVYQAPETRLETVCTH